MRRMKLAISAAALFAAVGAAEAATPLRLEYRIEAMGAGVYKYHFQLILDNNNGGWVSGNGWDWFIFGDGRRVSPMANIQMDPSQFPIGPWTSLTSSGGGHNGPTFNPVTNAFWIPNAVGDSLSWNCTSTEYLDQGRILFSTLQHVGGAQAANFDIAQRVNGGLTEAACCRSDGTCLVLSEASCITEGGVWSSAAADCSGGCPQPPTGACCRASGCVTLSQARCTATNGLYQGDGTNCATAGCTAPAPFSLTPPDFQGLSRVWAFSPSHSQTFSGGAFRATGFRLAVQAERAYEAFQSDLLMEIVSPNGTTLLVGGDGGTPLIANSIRWSTVRTLGTGPATNANPAAFDGTYSWDFGPADGTWTVNFWNNWGPLPVDSAVKWNDVLVTVLDAGAGACCLPDGTCVDTASGNCLVQNGIYQGDNAPCGSANCETFVFTGLPTSSMTNLGAGSFMNLIPAQDVSVYQFDYAATAAAGIPTTVEVWTYPGSYMGHDNDQTGWVLHETVNATSGGPSVLVPLNLATPLDLSAGSTTGVYLIAQSGGLRYFFSTATPLVFGSGGFQLFSDRRRTAPWAGSLGTFSPFSGRAYYDPTCTRATCDFALLTPYPPSASSTAGSGIFFDVTASSELSIDRVDYWAGSAFNTGVTASLYMKTGSYVGFDTDPSAWTHLGDFSGLSGGAEDPVVLDFASQLPPIAEIAMNPGDTVAFYVVGTTGGYRYRTTSPNPVTDQHMSLESNIARSALFGGGLSSGRRFAGRVHYTAGSGGQCYANCDNSTQAPVLNVADFGCFLTRYAGGEAYANCDESTQAPVLNVADFGCFLTKYAAGCP
ncbi:MAG: hypothetical protein WD749_13910 [Phycisphaerales bacterium]